jgi:nitrate reductase gamma subunit
LQERVATLTEGQLLTAEQRTQITDQITGQSSCIVSLVGLLFLLVGRVRSTRARDWPAC